MTRPTAAMIVIGDEILTGKIHDQNSHVLARLLFARGVHLRRVEVIPDDVELIAERVRAFSASEDLVFTSGGIGPTHDDVTYEGIARAFEVELFEHQPTLERMKAYYEKRAKDRGEDFALELNPARRRMATFPAGARLLPIPPMWVPIVVVNNVHILPGVPELFEKMVVAFSAQLSGTPLARVVIQTQQGEGEIADILREAAAANPAIAIGSYPRYESTDPTGAPLSWRVRVTFEGEDAAAVSALATRLAPKIDGSPAAAGEDFAV